MKKILTHILNGIIDVENIKAIISNCPKDWMFFNTPLLDPDISFGASKETPLTRFIRDTETYTTRGVLIHDFLLKSNPDLVLTTLDWHPIAGQWIEEANKLDIPTAVVVHEGFFPSPERWYSCNCLFSEKEFKKLIKNNPSLKSPPTKAKFVGCWSEYQKEIFLQRGADPETLYVTGQPRLDKFITKKNNSFTKTMFNTKINNIDNKPVITYCCQAMDTDEFSIERWKAQRLAIKELLRHCKNNNWFCYIRNHPTIGKKGINKANCGFIPIWHLIEKGVKEGYCFFDGVNPHSHVCDIYDTLLHVDLLLAQSSTTLLQALFMNVHPLILDLCEKGEKDPIKFSEKGGLPLIKNKENIEYYIQKYIRKKIDITTLSKKYKDFYLKRYLPGKLDGKNGKRVYKMLDKAIKTKNG